MIRSLVKVAEILRKSDAFRLEYQELCVVRGVTRASHRRTIVGRHIPEEIEHDAPFREQISRYFDRLWNCSPRTHDTRNGAHDLSALPTNHFYDKEQDEDICNGSKSMTPAQLHEVAIVLENEAEFCKGYRNPRSLLGRRNFINEWRKRKCFDLGSMNAEGREQLRRYFDDTLGTDSPRTDPHDKFAQLVTIEFWKDEVRYPEDCARHAAKHAVPLTVNIIKEPIMTATKTPIEITTKTLINGVDVKDYTDSQVYALIAGQEADIKELEKIEAKPKKLVAEIEKRRAGIAALVAYLDSKE